MSPPCPEDSRRVVCCCKMCTYWLNLTFLNSKPNIIISHVAPYHHLIPDPLFFFLSFHFTDSFSILYYNRFFYLTFGTMTNKNFGWIEGKKKWGRAIYGGGGKGGHTMLFSGRDEEINQSVNRSCMRILRIYFIREDVLCCFESQIID